MLPIMCDQLPCMSMAVRMVIKRCPEVISEETADHATNASPRVSSSGKTGVFTTTISFVTTGALAGSHDASLNGAGLARECSINAQFRGTEFSRRDGRRTPVDR